MVDDYYLNHAQTMTTNYDVRPINAYFTNLDTAALKDGIATTYDGDIDFGAIGSEIFNSLGLKDEELQQQGYAILVSEAETKTINENGQKRQLIFDTLVEKLIAEGVPSKDAQNEIATLMMKHELSSLQGLKVATLAAIPLSAAAINAAGAIITSLLLTKIAQDLAKNYPALEQWLNDKIESAKKTEAEEKNKLADTQKSGSKVTTGMPDPDDEKDPDGKKEVARYTAEKIIDELARKTNLYDHEGGEHNGHTIERHVGKSTEWLRDRLKNENLKHSTSYPDKSTAEWVVKEIITRKADEIAEWANDGNVRNSVKGFEYEFNKEVGYGINEQSSEVKIKIKARVVLIKSNKSVKILTSYPID